MEKKCNYCDAIIKIPESIFQTGNIVMGVDIRCPKCRKMSTYMESENTPAPDALKTVESEDMETFEKECLKLEKQQMTLVYVGCKTIREGDLEAYKWVAIYKNNLAPSFLGSLPGNASPGRAIPGFVKDMMDNLFHQDGPICDSENCDHTAMYKNTTLDVKVCSCCKEEAIKDLIAFEENFELLESKK